MSDPTVSSYWNQTTPAPPSGDQACVIQTDNAIPQDSRTVYPQRMVGDSGSGGKAGTVPPPAAGDGAAMKWLKATGAWLAIVASDLAGAVFGASGASHSVGAVPDPGASAGTTRFLREDATWVAPSSSGGVSTKTASYTALAGDNGTLLAFNSASAVTLTLPATPPSTTWQIAVQNVGAGTLTVSRNGLLIDTAAANLTLAQNAGVLIYTDGTNYFTERGAASGASIAGVQQESYTYAADTGTTNAYAVSLSPAPTLVAGSQVQVKIANSNTGGSTLAVNGGTATTILKQGSAALTYGDFNAGQIADLIYDGTNWQWLGSRNSGGMIYSGAWSSTEFYGVGAVALYSSKLYMRLVAGGGTGGTPTVIQSRALAGGPLSSISFSSNVTAGSLLVIGFADESTVDPSTVTDTLGTVYTKAIAQTGNSENAAIYYGIAPSSGACAVSFTTGGSTWRRAVISEVTGVAATVNATAQTYNGVGTNPYSVSITTTVAQTFLYAVGAAFHSSCTFTAGSGWTIAAQANGTDAIAAEYMGASTAGTVTPSFTIAGNSADNSCLVVAAFASSTPTPDVDSNWIQMGGGSGGSGTVTSVGMTVPSRQTVSGSPIIGSGTLAITDNTQSANIMFAGPASGSPAAPTFRAVVAADLPVMVGDTGSGGTKGAVPAPASGDAAAGKFLKADGTFAVPPGTGGASVMVASGTGHAAGLAPDPGATAGSTKFLREDATWAVPAGGGGGSGALVLLAYATASSSASVNFVTRNASGQSGAIFQSDYDVYAIEFMELVPATAGVAASIRVSTNGGTSYDSAADYWWAGFRNSAAGTAVAGGSAKTSMDMSSSGGVSNTANKGGFSGTLKVFNPIGGVTFTRFLGNNSVWAGSEYVISQFMGSYELVTAINAFQFFYSSGNIASGIIRVYGIQNS